MEAKASKSAILLLLLCICFLIQTGESVVTFPPSPLAKSRTFTFPFPFPFPFPQTPPFPGSPPVFPFPFPFPRTPTPPFSVGSPFPFPTTPIPGGKPFPFPGSPSGPPNEEAKACLADFHSILRSSKTKYNSAELDVTYALCHTVKELRPKCWPILFPYAPSLPPSLLANCGSPAPGPAPVNPPNLATI